MLKKEIISLYIIKRISLISRNDTYVTHLGLGEDYKNRRIGGWESKKSESIKDEERSDARNAVNFMYKYLHLSSKKEVTLAVRLSSTSSSFFPLGAGWRCWAHLSRNG